MVLRSNTRETAVKPGGAGHLPRLSFPPCSLTNPPHENFSLSLRARVSIALSPSLSRARALTCWFSSARSPEVDGSSSSDMSCCPRAAVHQGNLLQELKRNYKLNKNNNKNNKTSKSDCTRLHGTRPLSARTPSLAGTKYRETYEKKQTRACSFIWFY